MMTNTFILDLDLLNEQNLSLVEFMSLLVINNDINYVHDNKTLTSLQEKQFIKVFIDENETVIILREKAKILIDLISIEKSEIDFNNKKIIKKSTREVNTEVDSFIVEYRNLWKGLKPGSMGSESSCKDKMLRWLKENPSYKKEDIIKASKIYLNSLDNYKYLQRADYFIYKKEGKEESSQLSAFIDEIEVDTSDWTSKLN